MNQRANLHRIRRWPRWTIIPLTLGLAGLVVVVGFLLSSVSVAVSPQVVEPEPTMPAIAYSQGESGGCHDCHFSLAALQDSASGSAAAEAYLIDPESVVTPHGRLGCLACHGGDGQASDKEAAHQELVTDMSAQDPEKCLICHQDLPDEIPNDRLRVPHGTIVAGIEHSEPCDVHCSDCHGGVGHGFDPVSGEKICSMTVCVDCHQGKEFGTQMTDCDACHLGPHDVPTSMTCSDCHISTTEWKEVDPGIHPVPLPGKHGQTACFQCHQYPDFEGLDNACSACHESGHTAWGDHDCADCHDAGTTWDMVATTWDSHAEQWDQYRGQHLKVSCQGCHFKGYDLDPSCDSCHSVPESHQDGRDGIDCVQCHQADQPWAGE